jgi:hypothetical protein
MVHRPESDAMNEAILMKARQRMIEDRDPFAKVLASRVDCDRSERVHTKFVELQTHTEAIERAIKSEQQSVDLAATPPTSR